MRAAGAAGREIHLSNLAAAMLEPSSFAAGNIANARCWCSRVWCFCDFCFWFLSSLFATAILLMMLGTLYGFSYFWSVYCVSNHPRSLRNVGLNEALVGVANICEVLASQAVITYCHNEAAYYLLVALVLAVLIVARWLQLRQRGEYDARDFITCAKNNLSTIGM